jgi:opacity protein-like surface antigen
MAVLSRLCFAAPAVAVALLLLAPAPSARAEGMQLSRLELLTQSVKTSGQSLAAGIGLRFHLTGGDLDPGFSFVPAIENWEKLDRLPKLGVPEVRQRDWRLGADVRYRFGGGEGWSPYAGAGLALDITKQFVQTGNPGEVIVTRDDSGRKLAPNFLVGTDLPGGGRLKNAFEINYHLVPGLKQLKINWGIGYRFGKLPDSASN